MNRFVLGTANFGPAYGKRTHDMSERVAFTILDTAWEAGIRAFDTSTLYELPFLRLVRWLQSRRHTQDAALCVKLGPGYAIDGALLEAPGTLLMSHGLVLGGEWQTLQAIAIDAGVPAGQSVYVDDLFAVFTAKGLARVQAPLNAMDLRAVKVRNAIASAIPMDFRSVFLQGTLLEDPDKAEKRAPGTGQLASEVQTTAHALKETTAALLVSVALLACKDGDRVILGADAPRDIHEAIRGAEIKPGIAATFLRLLHPVQQQVTLDTLDPRRWRAMAGATS